MQEKTLEKKAGLPRHPVVVVMGHIDHGKSTLLDYIRKTNTTDGEAGGITQHLAAYEASNITFLDTPGHAAFTGIRERGSKTADIAVLVVSAEDGVKPQTLEAIDWIKKAKIPYLVAINKIDKPNINIERVKTELAEAEVLVEGWGGTVPCIPLSAKTGQGVEDLLETLKLQAEVDGLSYDPTSLGTGFVLESKRDPKRGISATLVVKDGVIKKGGFISAGKSMAVLRSPQDANLKQVDQVEAGRPSVISGWTEVPEVGKEFRFHNSKKEAEEATKKILKIETLKIENSENKKLLPIVIKADTVGSLEAIVHEARKIETDKIGLKISSYGVGDIAEADVKLARAFPGMMIIGFHVKTDPSARSLAERENITLKVFDIIYELVEYLEKELQENSPREDVDEISGKASILKIFSVSKSKQVVGGRVDEGEVTINSPVKIFRREAEVGSGHIKELQSKKVKTGSVGVDVEFGALIDSKIEIAQGDKIVCIRRSN